MPCRGVARTLLILSRGAVACKEARIADSAFAVSGDIAASAAFTGDSACEQALSALRSTGQPPSSAHAPGVAERFRRLGAAEWDALRTRFQAAE